MTRKLWTKQETQLLHEIRNLYTRQELAEMFNCTTKQIYNKLATEKLLIKQDRPADPPGYKTCPECKECLPFDCYSKHNGRKDGLQTYCKPCYSKIKSLAYRTKKEEKECKEEEKQAYIDSFKGKVLHCPTCGDQTINEYKVYWETRSQKFKRKCKKCSQNQTKQSICKKIKEQGYV